MFLLSGLIIGIIVAAAVLLVAVIILLVTLLSKKGNKLVVNDEFIDSIISLLGGKDNINAVMVDNARLKIALNDIKKPDFDSLKAICGQGVFITGNNVKVLFKYDSKTIKKEIEKKL